MNSTVKPNTGAFHTAPIKNNKATPAGHMAGAAGKRPGASPLSPQGKQSGRDGRNLTLKIRLNRSEYEKLLALLPASKTRQRGISKYVRGRIFSPRRSASAPDHSVLYRNLAGIKSELQRIARLANRIENPLTLVEVLSHLVSLDREVNKLTRGTTGKAPA